MLHDAIPKSLILIEINFVSTRKGLFLKMLIVSYTIWVAITFSPLLHRAVLLLSATNQPPIRPRRLLSPNRACFAPIVNSFTFVCDIKHFSEHFFNKPTTGTRVAADSAAASTALQPLLMLDVQIWIVIDILNAIWNFHWECVAMICIVLLEIFSHLFDDMPLRHCLIMDCTGMSICKSFDVWTFISAIFWIFNGQIKTCCQTYLVCQPKMNTVLDNCGSLFEFWN